MPPIVEYSDRPGYQNSGLDQFEFGPSTRPEAICLRVLLGTCRITNTETESSTDIFTNFLDATRSPNLQNDLTFLDGFEEDLSASDYHARLSSTPLTNRTFYNDFLSEISVAALAHEQNNGTSCFLHIYRAYERLSYAFPLIYASKSHNYIGSFESLKKWISDAKGEGQAGELAFFRNYLESKYGDELDVTYDFHLIGSDETKRRQFRLLKEKILQWKPEDVTPGTIENATVSVPFGSLHKVLLVSRNRYFHQMSGRPGNIRQPEIVDAELFFRTLSGPLLTYVAKLFHDVVVHDFYSA